MARFICIPEDALDGLDGSHQLLLLTLYRFANKGGTCWPSHETIAGKIGRSRQWVCLGLKHLEKLGRINVTRRRDDKGGKMSSVYSLPTHVQESDMGCPESHQGDVRNPDINKTQLNNTPTHARAREGVVPIQPTSLPEGWRPSEWAWNKASQNYPDADLEKFLERFHLRQLQRGDTCRSWDAKFLEWLSKDYRDFMTRKETDHAGYARHETKFERDRRSAEQLEQRNQRVKDELLARFNRRRGIQ